ncbi:MAG: hypothetical protein IKO85_06595 [Bacteroidaceae bacterium]|nr:hypothetical protein [Bacteroidaceae bacterium]
MKIKNIILLAAVAFVSLFRLSAQEVQSSTDYILPGGKEIYIPEELRNNDFTSKDSQWSYYRMACTPNVVCFWEKGFGEDLSKAPDLDGHPMTVDLDNLLSRVEYFYNVYRDMMGFLLPGSKAERYRMMVMLKYSLEGTAYGGCYDATIGGLWITPNRVQDKTLNCIAHELGHSFQIQIACDGKSQGMGGSMFETSAQWMLWQVNPRWTTDEYYHWEAYRKQIHLSLFHPENMYHAPFVMEYWSMLHGLTYMADLFRGGKQGEDFAQAYMRMYNVDMQHMGDQLLDCYSRLITFDFPDKRKESLRYAFEMRSEMKDTLDGWKKPVNAPQTYGFNVDEIPLPAVGKTVKVQFRGLSTQENIGYRYGLVAVDQDNHPTYLGAHSELKKTLTYKNPGNTTRLYLVVVGCPTKEYQSQATATFEYIIKY